MATVRCKVCGRTLRDPDSTRRGIGPSCAKHYPPIHLAEHTLDSIRKQTDDAYATARAALREKRFEPNPYLSLYLAHLSIEKMIKCVIWSRIKTFEHGHNLITLLERAIPDETPPQWMMDFLSELNNFQTAGKYPIEMEKITNRTDDTFIQSATSNMEEVLAWLSSKVI